MDEIERLLAGRRLFIFDLDGTLADSSPVHAAAFADALAPYGIAVDYPAIAGLTTESAMRRLLDGAGLRAGHAELTTLVAAKRAAARAGLAHVREIPGADTFITRAAIRHRLTLCTSAARATAEATLSALGWTTRFDSVVTADDVVRAKPAPDGFLTLLDRMGIPAGEALVFEDSAAGIDAARAAGIDAILIGQDGSDWPSLSAALAGATA